MILPSMVPQFFEYDDSFIQWLTAYAERRLIVDVGCGRGHLVRALVQSGHERVVGIDIRPVMDPDVEPRTIVADATESRLCSTNGLLLVLARPCHGAWIERVIERALASAVLFIGRPSKIDADLGVFAAKAVRLDAPGVLPAIGGEEIGVWSVKRPTPCLRMWLVESRGGRVNWFDRRTRLGPKGEDWMSDADGLGYWTNANGGGQPVEPKDKIIEGPVLFRTDIEVDWMRADWVREVAESTPHGPEGWISPWGAFYGCEYRQHDLLAYYVLGYEVRTLEALGWARCQKTLDGDKLFAIRHDDRELTDAQIAVVMAVATKNNLPLDA